jgi:hypothetical protein
MARANWKTVKLYTGEEKKILVNSVTCDPEKIKRLIQKRDVMLSDASRLIGFASNTLSSAIFAGVLSGPMAVGLEREYGIKPCDYEYIPSKEQKEEPKQTVQAEPARMDEQAMYTVMKTAMLDAMNECFAGNMKNLRGMVMTAIQQALKPV